jgi:hypothetical protein
MSEANASVFKSVFSGCSNKVLIISVIVVVLVTLFMYFRDQQMQRVLELRRIERRVEVLEEWGLGGRNRQW